MDQLPRLGKRELFCLLLFTCNYLVSVWRGFLFLLVLGMGYFILLWHSLGLAYNYFVEPESPMLHTKFQDHRAFGSGEDVLKVFAIYRCCCQLGHVTKTIFKTLGPLFPRRLHKMTLNGQAVSEMFDNNGHFHVYSTRVRAVTPGSFFVYNSSDN